ncbi:putative F-box-like domain protein [Rhizoctonia solani 123E]|uniref:Putative F-box-like domain protein n=1 Tax=Rhizoctonia solani 123E TaxID=1423351 RepID=A0A074RY47_9AGAM|nr:putative F-box-like domain protein [Rhizoctonia solani 123E]
MENKTKVRQNTTAAMKQVSPSSINALPSEILIRIFLLTVDSQSCLLHSDPSYEFTPTVPKHPDSLLLVCHRWHVIAISSRFLWAHIDVMLSCPQAELFLARAKAYVGRAQWTPLDIHIMDPGIHPRYRIPWTHDKFDCLLAHEPTPIRSLELVTHCKYHMSHLVALQYYLSRCAPGTLSRLRIRTEHPNDEPLGHFIEYGYVGDSLDVTTEDLEKPLNSITTLHLHGLYPYWTSQAYHGLADLYLGGGIQIPEERLIDILRSSPGLRALRLNCRITDPTTQTNEHGEYEDEPPFDVHLKDLEILDIHSLSYGSTAMLLRRLSYNSKPLRLCLSQVDRDDDVSHFLCTSENLNVTELRVTRGRLGDLYDYTERYARLHTLVIGEWDDADIPFGQSRLLILRTSSLHWYSPGDKSFETCLDTLYVIRISISYSELRVMVDYYSVRRLVLWHSSVRMSGRSGGATDTEMTALCSVVEILKWNEPNPVKQ